MRAPAALCLVFLILAGCTIGMSVEKYRPAQGPEGIQATLTLSRGVRIGDIGELLEVRAGVTRGSRIGVIGELLEVRDEGLVLLANNKVTLVPYSIIRRAQFDQAKRLGFSGSTTPVVGQREQLRLVSRFPQGLSDDVLNRLLAAYDQTELYIAQ